MNLEDFIDIRNLPGFDHSLSWKQGDRRPQRRTIHYKNSPAYTKEKNEESPAQGKKEMRKPATGAATGGKNTELPVLQRQRSNQSERGEMKRAKLDAESSMSGSGLGEGTDSSDDEDMEKGDDDIYTTPNGKNALEQ